MKKLKLSAWGNYPKIDANIFSGKERHISQFVSTAKDIIPFGNGRSYGDSALSESVVNMRKHNYFLDFDESTGTLHCQAGVLLSEIIDTFLPKGWFLNVSPGTKFVTVGGAIASDIHGKNHHVNGSFSSFVTDFRLMLPDGSIITCSQTENTELFKATCGGMGLTGVVLDARVVLKKVNSIYIDQTTIKTKNLDETFKAFEDYKDATYSVAWIDCLATGKNLGRCLLMVGEHSDDGDLNYKPTGKLNVPFNFPSFTLNKLTVKAFNTLYYNRVFKKISNQKITIDKFFYPLDAINNWNRIYGSNGFTQYQFVLPVDKSYEGLKQILSKIAASGKGSFLAVLKLFGKGNENYLSFPKEGYTLALDFKIEKGLFELLDELDKVVLDCGGRIYLTKDSRVDKNTFAAGYEKIDEFRRIRRQNNFTTTFSSLQSRRLDL